MLNHVESVKIHNKNEKTTQKTIDENKNTKFENENDDNLIEKNENEFIKRYI